MYEISKEYTWDMGHRITSHQGKCFSPHGHTYRAVIYVGGEKLDQQGMVVDFYQLDQVVKPVFEELDHAFLIASWDNVMVWFFEYIHNIVKTMKGMHVGGLSDDPSFMLPVLDVLPKWSTSFVPQSVSGYLYRNISLKTFPQEFKVKVVPWEPTAENIARYLFDTVKEKMSIVTRVEVWETPKSRAIYNDKEEKPSGSKT